MKKTRLKSSPFPRRAAGTVSAAALMLGVSHAATVGLHFQVNYCGAPAYSGYPVTLPAFGIGPAGWQSLTPMTTGYGSCTPANYYNLSQIIDTTTAGNGLNPLPNGSLNVSWGANSANYSGFAAYAGKAPGYLFGGPLNADATGEMQVYAGFLRDGVNFGPQDAMGTGGADNNQPGYVVDITGLSSVFTNTPYVVQLIAASDSMQTLTNAFIIDAAAGTTNYSVTYQNALFPAGNNGGAPWFRGQGGGLSTVSGALTTDHLKIIGNRAQHGTDATPNGYDNASTISGFIITDKPVVSMSPQPVLAGPGDNITLRALVAAVPPVSYQWRVGGVPIAGATNLSYNIPSATVSGNYDLVAVNAYGSATSKVAAVTVDTLSIASSKDFAVDTNPSVPPNAVELLGAKIVASSLDANGTNRLGVASFTAADPDQIVVSGASTNFDSAEGTISFWVRTSASNLTGNQEATLFDRRTGDGGLAIQVNAIGQVHVKTQPSSIDFLSNATISDNNWHLVTVAFDNDPNNDQAGLVALYIDGNADSGSYPANAKAWNWPVGQPIELGRSHDTSIQPLDGQLDDIRFYTRILNDAENLSLTKGAVVDASTLVLRLDFGSAPVAGLTLNWQISTDLLQSAPSINGPFTPVPNALPPYRVLPAGQQQYFRFTHTTATILANPYDM